MSGFRRAGTVFVALFLMAALLQAALPSDSLGGIYKWKDENGHWHFSDSPTAVAPAEEQPLPVPAPALKTEKAPAPKTPPTSEAASESTSRAEENATSTPKPASEAETARTPEAEPDSENPATAEISPTVPEPEPAATPEYRSETVPAPDPEMALTPEPLDKEPPVIAEDAAPAAASAPFPEEETAVAAAEPAADSGQEGLFWRISNGSAPPSYLLGTIHSSDPRVTRLRPAVAEALDRSDRFVMEMLLDASAMMAFGSTMVFDDGRSLASVLGPALYGQVVDVMLEYGLPELTIRNMKPWVIMAMLSMPKPSLQPILDLVLHQRAVDAGKPVAGLESAREQLSVFDDLTLDEQVDLLEMTLAQLPELPRTMERLLTAYIDDDLDAIARIAAGHQQQGDTALMEKFSYRLNDARNLRMRRRMASYLKLGNSFVAVGAMHLVGPGGLISLLREEGYTVAPVR